MGRRTAVLISGSGSNLQALLDAQQRGELGAQVALVLSDRADAYGLQRALQHGIACAYVPLPRGASFTRWRAALQTALQAIEAFGAQALVVSLGLDTFAGDPVAGFQLQSSDYLQVGDDLAKADLPTVLVFEGGYAVAEVGVNAANVLEAFFRT